VTDWATISSLATAGGTLVLAVATFSAVRSANRAARSAERALQVGLRPVLFPSRPEDAVQKLRWGDDHWARLRGGSAVLDDSNDVMYLAMGLRNAGSGIAVLHGWRFEPEYRLIDPHVAAVEQQERMNRRPDPGTFRVQTRDLYVPPGETSFWQAAIRGLDDADRCRLVDATAARQTLLIDLLYGDQEGGQRTISRFAVAPHPTDDNEWYVSVVRHWYLDRPDPR
jgi:hypothetical protein